MAPILLGVLSLPGGSQAQDLPPSTVQGSPPGFNYPMALEAVRAAPGNHHVIYEDSQVRFLEVTLMPFVKEPMHGHAYPSVFAVSQVQPTMDNEHLTPWVKVLFGKEWRAPGSTSWPVCKTLGPQAPHAATVTSDYPQHFFRLEFKRSETTSATDSAGARRVLFDSGLVRLVEVTLRPGATLPAGRTLDYAVNAYPAGADAMLLQGVSLPINGAENPTGLAGPICATTAPGPTRAFSNHGTTPIHYYRIEFTRIDGDDFANKWQELYPDMGSTTPAVSAK